MFDFSRFTGSFRLSQRMERSMRHTFTVVTALFRNGGDSGSAREVRHAVLALFKQILESDGPLTEGDLESLRQLLMHEHSPLEVDRLVAELKNLPPISAEDAAAALQLLPREELERVLRAFLVLAVSTDSLERSKPLIADIARRTGFSAGAVDRVTDEIVAEHLRRQRILRSGAGILVALIVIAVFILTATLLRSVIFGLIAAYVMLPVEKYFERRLREKRGLGHYLFGLADWILSPLNRLSRKLRRRAGDPAPEELQRRENRRIINRAVGLTCVLVVLVILMLGILFSSLTNHYVHNLSSSVRDWTEKNLVVEKKRRNRPGPLRNRSARKRRRSPPKQPEWNLPPRSRSPSKAPFAESSAQGLLDQASVYLNHLRERFEKLPLVKFGLDQVSRIMQDESAQRELAGILLRRTGGLVSFTASVLGMIVAILVDLLMTVFFFLLFLSKLAEFCGDGGSDRRQSEYLVRTVFNGSWLPGASEETVAEAQRIISGVIGRLRISVRGYLTLMTVDATVYTTGFYLLGVPYFPVLGLLAGCGILLPYIGPILSATLTVLVTLAVGGGDVSGAQLAGIIALYLVYNGIIEQFILYPAVIGESLGLTTLETIIVVLLGAIFAGIPGMILALPASSMIKYLVPQIYNCLGNTRVRQPAKEAGQ
ncbi:MAG: AI-2E family transporter [Lentisphaeria bacterium]|nr:MAG: AI-2E family transporter [Lentisphaeria bacterium]